MYTEFTEQWQKHAHSHQAHTERLRDGVFIRSQKANKLKKTQNSVKYLF